MRTRQLGRNLNSVRFLRWVSTVLGSVFLSLLPLNVSAQINTDRVIMVGRNALYYEDYVLAIQYFNQVISAKPWLYEPYFYRGLSKYYLDDYLGGEADCSEAINRNPFVPNIYEVRGLCRINLERFGTAAEDYRKAISFDPENRGLWQNLALCLMEDKRYDEANAELDTIVKRWPTFSKAYFIKAQVAFLQKDTLRGTVLLDTALVHDPYDADGWSTRGGLCLQKGQYKNAEDALDKAIHLKPKVAGNYINRALARYNQDNLRGTMSDYDMALDLDPNDYLGHFNRGLLRAQVGDDNRAIVDFNFVIKQEPDNMIALFNRALLLDKTGNYRGAIRDISRVIRIYPNFWTGYMYRAQIRRKIGDVKGAEFDEFRVLKAQLEKRYSGHSNSSRKHMRRKSDKNIENYNQLVVADQTEEQHTYASDYRGRVQDRPVAMELAQIYVLGYNESNDVIGNFVAYHHSVDELNRTKILRKRLIISCSIPALDSSEAQGSFATINRLTQHISQKQDDAMTRFARATEYFTVQDYENAVEDLNKTIELRPSMAMAYFQRAVARLRLIEAKPENVVKQPTVTMANATVTASYSLILSDLQKTLQLVPDFAYAYYNEGNIYEKLGQHAKAIEAFTNALRFEPHLPQAYYNRGIVSLLHGDKKAGRSDLSKAGELGLYGAYSLLRQYTSDNTKEKGAK
jgi:tetratricopeptide (TPR) repeat protein